MELCYLRDTSDREIDFVVLKNKKNFFAIECQVGEREVSKNIKYFKPDNGIEVISFIRFCEKIGTP